MTNLKPFLFNGIFIFLFFIAACAPKVKPVEIPEYKGTLESFLAENAVWEGLSGSFNLNLTRPDRQVQSADAFIDTGPGRLEMRFYKLGFPAGELVEGDPRYDDLKEAIRSGLIWWQMGDFRATSLEHEYLIETETRSLVLDRKTLVPLSQSLISSRGIVNISYSDYRRLETLWYPYKMEIKYSGYELELTGGKIELKHN